MSICEYYVMAFHAGFNGNQSQVAAPICASCNLDTAAKWLAGNRQSYQDAWKIAGTYEGQGRGALFTRAQ